MRRRLFHVSVAVSCVLGFAIGALWLRSYWRSDMVRFFVGDRFVMISSYGGRASFVTDPRATGFKPFLTERWRTGTRSPGYWEPRYLWEFRARTYQSWPPKDAVFVISPYWAVWAPWTVLPALWLWRRGRARRRARAASHLCRACGYDLRGGSGGGCPECGAPAGGERREASA